MGKMVLNKDLYFETKFYTIEDIGSGECEDKILDFAAMFTENIVLDLREYLSQGGNAFRLIIEGYEFEDIAEIRLEIYSVYADINHGLEAELVGEYSSKEITLEQVQELLDNIELPHVTSVTKAPTGLKSETEEYYESEEVIEYAKEYEPLDCDCWHDECTHEPTWSYDYSRPIGVRIVDREYERKYLVLDLEELEDDEE